ncbi:MAG: LytTR family transcriptional regulator [Rhodobacteraceae bacterium]|nr:LytTR family transcriptional regulator [Paracoccaceae bacterium]
MRERMTGMGQTLAARLALPLAVGLLLGLIGPFGTYGALPLGRRLVYWLALVSLNWMLADAIVRRVDAVLGPALPARRASVPLLGALATAFPATGVVALAGGRSGLGWPGNVAVLFGQVLLLLAAISLPVYAWEDGQEARASPATGPPFPDPVPVEEAAQSARIEALARFARRFPAPLPGQLLCLEMQDHYLVAHTTGGSPMVLCRMEDAARELEPVGLRVHRSWWVARGALEGTEREGQRLFLRLKDGRRVPVGRSFRARLRAAGWT